MLVGYNDHLDQLDRIPLTASESQPTKLEELLLRVFEGSDVPNYAYRSCYEVSYFIGEPTYYILFWFTCYSLKEKERTSGSTHVPYPFLRALSR